MSDVTKRTVFYYKDKQKIYNTTDSITETFEYIKFLPFCLVIINGVNYIEPWNGVVVPNYIQANDGMSADWDPQNVCNLITDMKEVDVDKFSLLLTGDGGSPCLFGGTLNTKDGK